ncbi:hypothetical protein BC936DRAFT_149036 [Jimgerdemannia flammicorona]|uniref:Uncharacterized protein n=1 Tax=Jimgerdemannia flammicorona TaxID=994334 RepID=A0A433D1R5_9FUNG|nr:hypothetical protein BC936DRAFT_149036 [Jimgerdemannia flammicorona]
MTAFSKISGLQTRRRTECKDLALGDITTLKIDAIGKKPNYSWPLFSLLPPLGYLHFLTSNIQNIPNE